MPWFTSCTVNATIGCSEAEQQLWLARVNSFNQSLNSPICNSQCPEQQQRAQELGDCRHLNGGLDAVATQIRQSNAGPADTVCQTVLLRINDCLDFISLGCPVLEDAAFLIKDPYRSAFGQCNIDIKPRTPFDIDAFISAGVVNGNGPDASPTTTLAPGAGSELSDTTRVVLYAAIGICSLVILAAGVAALVMCANRKKKEQLVKEVEKISRWANRGNTNRTLYPHAEEAEEDTDFDFDDAASQASVGPYRPGGRWWTRPNFGASPSAPVPDEDFRDWTGARPKHF